MALTDSNFQTAPTHPVPTTDVTADTSSEAATAQPDVSRSVASTAAPAAPAQDPNFSADSAPSPQPNAPDPNFAPDPAPQAAQDPNFEPDPKALPIPDVSAAKKMAAMNFKAPEGANSWWQAMKAGFQDSSGGLALGRPTVVLPENAPRFYKIASLVGHAAGDIPAMALGGIGGMMAGAGIGGSVGFLPGAISGATYGGFIGAGALPAAIRKMYMDHYEKGDMVDAGDFANRFVATALEALKGGTINLATMGTGKYVGGALEGVVNPLVGTAAKNAAEISVMTTASAAMEGRLPKMEDLENGAIVVTALHAASGITAKVGGKMADIYSETGVRPEQVSQMATENPVLKQKLIAMNGESVPDEIKEAAPPEEISENDKAFMAENPTPKEVSAPATEGHSDLNDSEPQSELSVPQMPEEGVKNPEEPPALTDAEKYIASKIKTAPEEVNAPFNADKLYQRVLDQTHGIGVLAKQLADGKELSALKDPQILARLTAGTNSAFNHAVEHGPFDPVTREKIDGVKSYNEIFKPIGDRMDQFERYMVSKRIVELDSRGIKAFGNDTKVELAAEVAKQGDKEFGPVAEEYGKWKNSFIDYGAKLGLFSEESAQSMKDMNQNHISFKRLLDGVGQAGPGGKNLKVLNPLKAIQGSENDLVDPLKNDMMNAYKIMQMANRNQVINTLAGLAADNPEKAAQENSLFQKATPAMQKITVTGEELNKYFDDRGVSPDATSADIWRAKHEDLGPNQVQSFVDGKRVVWDTTPLAAEAIKGIDDVNQADLVNKFINGPGRILRTSQLMSPIFAERHLVRSWLNAFGTSESGESPFPKVFDAIGGMFKKSEDYQEFLRSGGANEAISSIQDYIDKNMEGLEKETGVVSSLFNVVRHPIESGLLAFHKMEETLHFAKYLSVKDGDSSPESIAEAAYKARSVNGDIAMRGSSQATKWYSAATPFWAQHMAGLAETAKTFIKDPVAAAAKMSAVYTIPAIVNWWQNKDDERWRNLPPFQKIMTMPILTNRWEDAPPNSILDKNNVDNSHTRIGPNGQLQVNNGSVWRVPMFETGMVFASLPVAVLDAWYRKSPKSFEGFGEALFHGALPMDIPTVLHAPLEQFANKSTLTNNPLIPSSMEGKDNIDAQYKYTDYTTETAKQIGKVIHQIPVVGNTSFASPIIVENYVRSWTGMLGMYALKLADKGLENLPESVRNKIGVQNALVKPDGTFADNPFLTAFSIRYPSMNAQSVQDFFKNYDDYKTTQNTLMALKKRGDLVNLDKEMKDPENQAKLIPLDAAHKAISNISTYVHSVLHDPTINPHDKRQLTDSAMIQMIQTATGMNKDIENMRKSLQK